MDKLLVRQAVAHGLDRAVVDRAFYGGRGRGRDEFMPPGSSATRRRHEVRVQPGAPKALLQQAGLTLPVDRLLVPERRLAAVHAATRSGTSRRSRRASRVRLQGHVEERAVAARLREEVNEGTAGHLNLIGWTGDYGDPDNFLGTFFQSSTRSSASATQDLAACSTAPRAETDRREARRALPGRRTGDHGLPPGVPYAHAEPGAGRSRSGCEGYVPEPGYGRSLRARYLRGRVVR